MSDSAPLLIELGTEELPPKNLRQLEQAFGDAFARTLEQEGFTFEGLTTFATPRRLAVLLESVQIKQAEQTIERRGPALSAAYDASGQATKALAGFARSCGVEPDTAFETIETDKGAWVVYRAQVTGQHLSDRLQVILEAVTASLPIAKRMRWENLSAEFVRPVRWVVALIGEDVVPISLFGCEASSISRGHRFMSRGDIALKSPSEYEQLLKDHFVVASLEQRRVMIWEDLKAEAARLEGILEEDPALLDEVASLTEWPVVLSGAFDPSFLRVPSEVLISAMREHQRYFHLRDASGALLPRFITVANIKSEDPDVIIRGNERVITPRLADAAFFYDKDLSQPLSDWLERLHAVVYQADLGTYFEKARRLGELSKRIARLLSIDETLSERAGRLAKADLLSGMVGEFPELQGIMGEYYAIASGEPADISSAIKEHYQPRFSGDVLPTKDVSFVVALADRLDALVGLFGVNQPPTGSKDPFALRRQAIAVVRLCVEKGIRRPVFDLVDEAAHVYDRGFETDAVKTYLVDRFEQWSLDQGVSGDVVRAILCRDDAQLCLSQSFEDMATLREFKAEPSAASLIQAQKRINNILEKTDIAADSAIDPSLFQHSAESAVVSLAQKMLAMRDDGLKDRLDVLAEGLPHIEAFFEHVLVMADDLALRSNRLASLKILRNAINQIADLSLLDPIK